MKQPYIGIAGFTQPDQVEYILEVMTVVSSHKLMIGIQVSEETLHSGVATVFTRRFPPVENVAMIFPHDPRVMNYIHYNTKNYDTLSEQLIQVTEYVGEKLHGFQLNLTWPVPATLERYRDRFPEIGIVLQMGKAAISQIDSDPDKFSDKLEREYKGLIDYILLDPGEGYGHPLDPEDCRRYLREMAERKLDIGPGVAGGIAPDTMHLVEPLVGEFPNLCFDSEAPFRDSEDRMILELAREYLVKGLELFQAS